MSDREATLIVLAWNRWNLTERCLSSLLETDLPGCDIIVVDNGSTDETPRRLKDYPGIQVITLEHNVGFVRGNNAAIEAAAPDSDIVLLNNWVTLHRRHEFEDHDDPQLRRHLLRVWLAMPNSRPLDPLFRDNYGATEAGAIRGGMRPMGD